MLPSIYNIDVSVQNGVNKNAMQLDFIFIQTSASSQLTDFEEKRFVGCVDAATQKTAHSRVFYHFFHTLFLFFLSFAKAN